MADTDLGELRRPARPIEQRIERIARWRAQGLAGGQADSTFPADATDGAVFASGGDTSVVTGGGGAGAGNWEYDTFSLTSATTNLFTLTAVPVDKSEVVRVNGLVLTRAEYTITSNVLTFTDLDAVRLGIGADTWTIALNYAYTDLATPGGSVFTGAFVIGTNETFPEAIAANDVGILFCRDDGGTPSGVFSTWTQLRDATSTGMDIWVGSGVGSGTSVDISTSFGDAGLIAVFRGVEDAVTIADLESTVTSPPTTGPMSTTAATATTGQLVVSAAMLTNGSGGDLALDGSVTTTGFGSPLSAVGSGGFYDIGIVAGVAASTSVSAEFGVSGTTGGGSGGGSEVVNVVFSAGTTTDPVVAIPGGDYVPPTPPTTPGTHVLRYQRPDTTGYTALDVVAGGTFNLDNGTDYAITASGPIDSNYVRLVGGRNLDVYGLVFDFDPAVPTGSYDADRRGLHIKDGPNPNLKRVIYIEGLYLRSGYYSDGIQVALRHENDVTLIVQAMRSDAKGWGQRSGVHSDLIQFYGGPLNFFGDCITGTYQTYQGIFMRPADGRPLPSGADKTDWQLSRVNLESGDGPSGGAHYLLWDDQPAWTGLTLDEVYITGASGYDVTDGNANMPATGLFQNATPSGGDWAPSSWWVGDTYTSPGYV